MNGIRGKASVWARANRAEILFRSLKVSQDMRPAWLDSQQRHPGPRSAKDATKVYQKHLYILHSARLREWEASNQEK